MSVISSLSADVLFWLILTVIFFVVEAMVPGLVTIWFAFGSIVGAVLALMHASLPIQVLGMLIVAAILLFFTRPLAKRLSRKEKTHTNADRYVGKRAVVTERINNLNHTGRATVLGQDWSISTENDTDIIEQGEVVEVVRINGAKLIVRKAEEEQL